MSKILDVKNLTVKVNSGKKELKIIDDISLSLNSGETVGIIGESGCGKSITALSILRLLEPNIKITDGIIEIENTNVRKLSAKELRKICGKKVGMVFQYPEHQLFEETIAEDIAFGPKNLGLSADEVDERVRDAMKFVGLDYNTYAERSPFHLSGGQMRRVAIAGVVAMNPDFLVLDEPSAGLDPFGREEIFEEIIRLHKEKGITVILVSHNMEDISRMASRLVVLDKGRIVLDGEPMDIFNNHRDELQAVGVDVPPVSVTMEYLREQGLDVSNRVLSVDDAVQAILEGGSHVK